jgi:hypothetical protein
MLPEPQSPNVGLWIVGFGLLVVVIGLLVWSGALAWFGRLPGDIRYESGSTRVYVPWVSMLVISLALSLLRVAFRRIF